MIKNIMNSCGVSQEEAKQLLREEIEMARENFQADGNLFQAVEDALSGLGLEADFEIQVAQLICAC